MPKAYGEVEVATNVPGVELLNDDSGNSDSDADDGFISYSEKDDEDVGPTEHEGYDEGDIFKKICKKIRNNFNS